MAIITAGRTRNEIMRDGRERLQENVGINSTNSTSTAGNLLELTAEELANLWDTMNDKLRRNFLTTAYGDSLDKLGELLSEPRRGSTRALDLSTSNIKFELDTTYASNITDLFLRYYDGGELDELVELGLIDNATTPGTLSLEAGLYVISQDSSISYVTTNPISFTNSQLVDYTPVTANGVGDGWNVGPNILTNHNIVTLYPILSRVANAITVVNKFGIRNGDSLETDENYRFRLANKTVSAATGNEAAIRKATLSVPGVVDMAVIHRSHGNGTLTIFPKTEEPIISDGVIAAVRESVASVKSAGTIIFVDPPNILAASLRIELRFAPGADKNLIYGQARLGIMDYINNLDEGGEIIINEMVQIVMSVSDKIIDMNITAFGYGDYDRNTGVITNYVPLRTINQKADWDQRFYINSSLCTICEAGQR